MASEREPAGGLRGGGPEPRTSSPPAGAAWPGVEHGGWRPPQPPRSLDLTVAGHAAEIEAETEGSRNKVLPNEEEERNGLIHARNLKDKLAV